MDGRSTFSLQSTGKVSHCLAGRTMASAEMRELLYGKRDTTMPIQKRLRTLTEYISGEAKVNNN